MTASKWFINCGTRCCECIHPDKCAEVLTGHVIVRLVKTFYSFHGSIIQKEVAMSEFFYGLLIVVMCFVAMTLALGGA
jgi:hypothetical protein